MNANAYLFIHLNFNLISHLQTSSTINNAKDFIVRNVKTTKLSVEKQTNTECNRRCDCGERLKAIPCPSEWCKEAIKMRKRLYTLSVCRRIKPRSCGNCNFNYQ